MNSKFQLPDVSGKIVETEQFKNDKGLIVVFTCNHCPYAVANEDRLINLHEKFQSRGFPLVAICSNDANKYPQDSLDNMIIRAKEKDFKFPYLRDESQEIAKNYNAVKTPHAYVLLWENDMLKVVYDGAIDDNWESQSNVKIAYVEQVVDAIINNEVPPVNKTTPVGCTIKWK